MLIKPVLIPIAVFALLVLHGTVTVHAQKSTGPDSSNFISYFDKILIKANSSSQADQYTLRDPKGTDLQLRANNEFKTFLSLDYEFIGFSVGFTPRFLSANDDDRLKGHSSFTDYKVQLLPGQWLQTVAFKKTKGYYVENTGDFVPGWQKDQEPYLQLQNLKNVQWAMSTSYVFNPDFSFKNIIYQTQWQKRSAGSFVPTLYYDYNRFAFDLAGVSSLQKEFNVRLGLGYYYTFIIARKFYISPSLVPAIGFCYARQYTTENGNEVREKTTYLTRFLDGGIKLGYNTDRWVAGAGLTFTVNRYKEDPARVIENDKLYGIVYIGYRFGTPKIITKTYKALSEKLP